VPAAQGTHVLEPADDCRWPAAQFAPSPPLHVPDVVQTEEQ